MAAFAGPVLGFGCSERHTTYRNIRETDEFAISIPDTRLARLAWDMGRRPSSERADLAGIAFAPARVIRAPLVADCPAHLECRYVSHVTFDDGEVFIFGRIVAAQVDVRCADGDATAAYATLDPAFFLEERLFAGLARPQAVERQHPAGYPDEPPGRRSS